MSIIGNTYPNMPKYLKGAAIVGGVGALGLGVHYAGKGSDPRFHERIRREMERRGMKYE